MEIGETYVEDPSNSVGKTITLNLMVLTRDPKKQNMNITFKIKEFKDNNLYAEVISLGLQSAQLKRMTRKAKKKIDDSFAYNTKDNVKVRIKPIMLTKAITPNSILTALRKSSRESIDKFVKNINFTQLVDSSISGELQKIVKNGTKQVYPLAYFVVKRLEKV